MALFDDLEGNLGPVGSFGRQVLGGIRGARSERVMESGVAHGSDGSPEAGLSPARCKNLPKRGQGAARLHPRGAKAAHPVTNSRLRARCCRTSSYAPEP